MAQEPNPRRFHNFHEMAILTHTKIIVIAKVNLFLIGIPQTRTVVFTAKKYFTRVLSEEDLLFNAEILFLLARYFFKVLTKNGRNWYIAVSS